jgi:hypothetical protein
MLSAKDFCEETIPSKLFEYHKSVLVPKSSLKTGAASTEVEAKPKKTKQASPNLFNFFITNFKQIKNCIW